MKTIHLILPYKLIKNELSNVIQSSLANILSVLDMGKYKNKLDTISSSSELVIQLGRQTSL